MRCGTPTVLQAKKDPPPTTSKRSPSESSVFRHALIALIAVTALAAFLFAGLLRDRALIAELQHDLKIADRNQITILDRTTSDGILAVVEQSKTFKLFVCYRDFWNSGREGPWEIPFFVGSGAPPGELEVTCEHSLEFDHFPSDAEITRFRKEYGL